MASEAHREPTARRFMTWLLRSPFSGLLDGSVMLLTVRGRRTGTEDTLPVQYAEEGGTIWVLPGHHERKRWWRNLLDESPVRLRLRGHEFDAVAQAFSGRANPSLAEDALAAYVRRFRAVGAGSGSSVKEELSERSASGRWQRAWSWSASSRRRRGTFEASATNRPNQRAVRD